MPNGLRCVVQVTAGLIVGKPMPEYSKQWSMDSDTYRKYKEGNPEAIEIWDRAMEASLDYTASLENPGFLNWVIRSWIWL